MKNSRLTEAFIKEFKQKFIECSSIKEKAYEHLLFRQFKGAEDEIQALGSPVLEIISATATVRELLYNLKYTNIRKAERLSSFTTSLIDMLHNDIKFDPSASAHYHDIITALHTFKSWIDSFQQQVLHALVTKLEIFLSENISSEDDNHTCQDEITDLIVEMERYSDCMLDFYRHFDQLWKREANSSKGISIASRLEEDLFRLITLFEQMIMTTESTHGMMEELTVKQHLLQIQEIYN